VVENAPDEHEPAVVATHETASAPLSNVRACRPSPPLELLGLADGDDEALELGLVDGDDEAAELGLVDGDDEAPELGLVEGDDEAAELGLVDGDDDALELGLVCGVDLLPPPPQPATARATATMASGPPRRAKRERFIIPP
jgi:hypothetical protein